MKSGYLLLLNCISREPVFIKHSGFFLQKVSFSSRSPNGKGGGEWKVKIEDSIDELITD
jgi:hypothetical protein